jgi:RNA polymerase sigma factor (sigma-70 family)
MVPRTLQDVLRHLRKLGATQANQELSDSELLQRFRDEREETAMAVLLQRHGPMVLSVCQRILRDVQAAEDAFQAVFLVLIRQPTAIRKPGSLASWLYGVARRIAVRARSRARIQHERERQVPTMPNSTPPDELAWQEVRSVLDEALAALPERYRAPVVLCYFEGKSYERAARELGCPKSTLASRLTQARTLLRQRLLQRGITISAAALAAGLTEMAAGATLPVLLNLHTVKGVTMALAGKTSSAGVSSAAVVLAEELIQGMVGVKGKILLGLLVVGLVAGGAGLAGHQATDRKPAPAVVAGDAPAPAANADNEAPPAKETTRTIRGRVLDPDGKPLGGAKLLLLGKAGPAVELGRSDADGRFVVAIPKGATDDDMLIAQTNDAGIDFAGLWQWKKEPNVELRLVKDQPIRGRVLDTQGKPVISARVEVNVLSIYTPLDSFLNFWKRRTGPGGWFQGEREIQENAAGILTTTTDLKGQFTLQGVGAERVVSLRLRGAGIADAALLVVNRSGFDPKPYNEALRQNASKGARQWMDKQRLHGPEVTVVAEPERIVRGVVCDAVTGKGRPNVRIWVHLGGEAIPTEPYTFVGTTDAQGRYEFHGARKAPSYTVTVARDVDARYPACEVRVADTSGYQPVTADIRVPRGVLVTGRMLDRATGKPLHGSVAANVLAGNRFVKDYPTVQGHDGDFGLEADGTFRLVTIPGPVLLTGLSSRVTGEEIRYPAAAPDPQYPQYFIRQPHYTAYYVSGGGFTPMHANYCKVLQIEPGTEAVRHDIVLEAGKPFRVKVLDAEGKPLLHTYVAGLHPDFENINPQPSDECSVYYLSPERPRPLLFFHYRKKLAAAVNLKGTEEQPFVVRLAPAGSLQGRLVNGAGEPLAQVVVDVRWEHDGARRLYDLLWTTEKAIVTDAAGRFTVPDLISSVKFNLRFRRGQRYFERVVKPADAAYQVESGQVRELGEVRLREVDRQ